MQDKELSVEIGILKNELKNILLNIKDLKETQQREIIELRINQQHLFEFMYKLQGGKAWFFGLLSISATIGAIFSAVASYLFVPK